MKICVISTTVMTCPPPGYSGLEMLAWQQAKGLAEKGHKVLLVAPRGSTVPYGIELHETTLGESEKRAYSGYWQKLPQFDCIIDNSWQKCSYLLKREGRLKAPILCVTHAPIETMFNSPPPVEFPCLVSISKDQAERTKKHLKIESKVAYNGCDVDFYKPSSRIRNSRYLFLARMSSIKGPDIAINVALKCKVGLDLVGDDTITSEPDFANVLKEQCTLNPGLRYIGPQGRKECVIWFNRNKALLHPNERFAEPYGLAPVEAQLCFPSDVQVKAVNVKNIFSHTYTGILLQLHTNRGKIECTPEHPFMTQRGWISAKNVTINDSLVWNKNYATMDTKRIGDFVKGLLKSGTKNSSEEYQQNLIFRQVQSEEIEIASKQPPIFYEERRGCYSEILSKERGGICCSPVEKARSVGSQESKLYGDRIRCLPSTIYEKGRIQDSGELLDIRTRESIQGIGSDLGIRCVESECLGSKEKATSQDQVSSGPSQFGRTVLFSRNNRRGGECIYKEVENKEEHSSDSNFQHVRNINPVDTDEGSYPQCNNFKKEGEKQSVGLLGNFNPGTQLSSSLQSFDSLSNHQKTSYGNAGRVDFYSVESTQGISILKEEREIEEDDSVYEFTRVWHISRREVTDLPVFNLGTRSGTYQANGFLVHNCGMPVIAWNNGAMPETVKHGETGFIVKSSGEIEEIIQNNLVADINPERCREWASQFSIQNMVNRYEELCTLAIETGGW